MNSPEHNNKGPGPLTLTIIVLFLFGLGLSSKGREVIDHPNLDHTPVDQAFAWPFQLFLDQGWAQLTPKGEVGGHLWLEVLAIEGVACGIVIAVVVLGGVVLIKIFSRERRGRKRNEV